MGGGRTTGGDRVSTCTGLGTPEWKALCFATCRSRQMAKRKTLLRTNDVSPREVSYTISKTKANFRPSLQRATTSPRRAMEVS